MFPAPPQAGSNALLCASIAITLCLACNIGLGQEANAPSKGQTSSYPVVVLERDAQFSIPNADAEPAVAQPPVAPQPFLPKKIYQRNAQAVLDATDLISEGFQQSVVEVMREEERLALATVISLKGHVITKYSLIKDLNENQIHFGSADVNWSGTLVGFDDTNDIALFALHSGSERPEKALRPIAFTTDGRLQDGKLVIGVGTDSKSISVGMTTLPPTAEAIDRDCETCIDMGLTLNNSLVVTRVYPRTVGERLGLLVGDRIDSINRRPIQSKSRFEKMEKEIQVGDLITLRYVRNSSLYEITDRVPELTKLSKRDRWGGGPFSKRRNGFGEVLVHDSVIEPTDCGGPLVNLQGQFCGINIARSMRVASLAIPAAPVQEFLLRYLNANDMVIEKQVERLQNE